MFNQPHVVKCKDELVSSPKHAKSPSRVWTAENILVISVLTLSAAGPIAAGLYANGYWA